MSLEDKIKEFGFNIDCIDELLKYKELLIEWNDKINLTAIKDSDEIDVKHFLDSLSIFNSKYLYGKKKVIDVGTGAGFPGLVLKIYNKDLDVTLFDSLNKRLKFLQNVIDELGLKDIKTLHGRAEEFGRKSDYREEYDIVVSRAVANMNTLLEYTLPFTKVGGYFIAMKGPEYKNELEESEKAIEILGAKLEEIIEVKLPMNINHYLVVLKKINSSPKKYPRAGGKPKSNPIK